MESVKIEEMSEEEVDEEIKDIQRQIESARCCILRAEFKRDEVVENYNESIEEYKQEIAQLLEERDRLKSLKLTITIRRISAGEAPPRQIV